MINRHQVTLAGVVLAFSALVAVAANAVRERRVPWLGSELPIQSSVAAPESHRPTPADAEPTNDSTPPPAADGKLPPTVALPEVERRLAAGTAKFVDARKPELYAEGHIRGAFNLPSTAVYEKMENVMAYVIPTEPVIVYCGGGDCEESHNVADVMRQYGFTNVAVYVNGWAELEKSPRRDELTARGSEP